MEQKPKDFQEKAKAELELSQQLELAWREIEWLSMALDESLPRDKKIPLDSFYRMHRQSTLGEAAYRHYVLTKLDFIQKYTSQENFSNAFKAIVLNKNIDYEIPIEFTRNRINHIKDKLKFYIDNASKISPELAVFFKNLSF